ncbi:phosphoglycerate mutase-like protein [Daedalea quercina L-15889]|uniref:Phosphoglycerate mutase-like protein n=1 Tax=Daedalea quercina L-15889 TaxID=1314783 RepID=A0A165R9C7_9APHY|nr:phosphoglycerate mutase-like protein [Daedalea quercina L-15889]
MNNYAGPSTNVASAARGLNGSVPLDVSGYPVAPAELELEQVHVYIRHGERTPVGVRMADPPASIPKHWMFCHTGRDSRAAIASTSAAVPGMRGPAGAGEVQQQESLRTVHVVERSDGSAAPGECLLGELTDIGRQTTYDYGRALRQLYIDKLGFLPDIAHSHDGIYLRSTNVPRTIESLQQIVHGLYPDAKSTPDFVPRIRIRNGKDENLIGNTLVCKRLETLQVGFAKAAASEWNDTLASLDKKVSKYIGGNPIRLDGKPRASGILDTVRAANAHAISIPSEFKDPAVIDLIEKAVVHEWFAGYQTEEVRRLGMGPLLSDLSRKLQAKAERGDRDPLKILIHSTHDTSLAALCSTLDVFDNRWPAFSSAITFELFRRQPQRETAQQSIWQNVLAPLRQQRSDGASEYYVRMRYQNRNLPLPICAGEGKHLPGSPEFCTLAAFRERIKQLTPVDWDTECAPSKRHGKHED